MLSQQDNERYTRVGKGTPMGELMRCCWPAVQTWRNEPVHGCTSS